MQRDADAPATCEVFYVEDHPTNVHLMKAVFRHRPHLALVVAVDGGEARRLAQRLRPSLLLLDLRLPDCHGSSLLEELRLLDGWADIPAVAVTAERDVRADRSTFCEVWPKPLDLAHVLSRLDVLLARPRLETAPLHQRVLQPQ